MNRFKKEMALKVFFKLHSHQEAQQVAGGYTKWVLLMRPKNYGAFLCSQNYFYNPLPHQIANDLKVNDSKGVIFLKEVYKKKLQIKIEAKFRPLKILREKELSIK